MPRRAAAPLALSMALAALAAGCGADQAHKDLARVRSACASLVGATVAQAAAALQLPIVPAQTCTTALGPLGAGDTCPGAPAAYTAPVCQVGFEACSPGSSVCTGGPAGGCAYACIVRVAAATPAAIEASSVVCATQFVSGQPYGPISGVACQ